MPESEEGKMIDGVLHTKESIVKQYEKLVYLYANRLAGSYEMEDLASEGFIALLKAFKKYDGKHNLKFSTYASFRIHQHLLIVMRRPPTGPHFPHAIVTLAWKMVKMDLDDLPAEEIAAEMEQPIDHIKRALLYLYQRHPAKLDGFVADGESETEMYGIIGTSDDMTGLYVRDFLNGLTDTERTIVDCLQNNMTQKETGKVIGYSQMHTSRFIKVIREKYGEYQKKALGIGGYLSAAK